MPCDILLCNVIFSAEPKVIYALRRVKGLRRLLYSGKGRVLPKFFIINYSLIFVILSKAKNLSPRRNGFCVSFYLRSFTAFRMTSIGLLHRSGHRRGDPVVTRKTNPQQHCRGGVTPPENEIIFCGRRNASPTTMPKQTYIIGHRRSLSETLHSAL